MRALGSPAAADQLAPRSYVDKIPPNGFWRSGCWSPPSNYVEGVAGTPTVSGTNGNVTFVPIDTPPAGVTITALGVNVTTAQSGGTATLTLGIYLDDGSWGMPLLTTAGLIASGNTGALTATGTAQLAASLTLAPNARFWLAALYRESSAPTTKPAFTCVSRSAPNLPLTSGLSAGLASLGRAWLVQTVAALPTAAATVTTYTGAAAPAVFALAA